MHSQDKQIFIRISKQEFPISIFMIVCIRKSIRPHFANLIMYNYPFTNCHLPYVYSSRDV